MLGIIVSMLMVILLLSHRVLAIAWASLPIVNPIAPYPQAVTIQYLYAYTVSATNILTVPPSLQNQSLAQHLPSNLSSSLLSQAWFALTSCSPVAGDTPANIFFFRISYLKVYYKIDSLFLWPCGRCQNKNALLGWSEFGGHNSLWT